MTTPEPILVETACWPLVIMVTPARLTTESISALITSVDALYARGERFATLVDTGRAEHMPTAAERRLLSDWQTRTIEQIRRHNVCTATVVTNPLIRGAMVAINWVFRPPNEQVTVATFSEALHFCLGRIHEEGLPLPSALEAERRTPTVRSVAELLGRLAA